MPPAGSGVPGASGDGSSGTQTSQHSGTQGEAGSDATGTSGTDGDATPGADAMPGSTAGGAGTGSNGTETVQAGAGGDDDELDEALKDLDGTILAEREFILTRTNAQAGSRPLPRAGAASGEGSAGTSGDGDGSGPAEGSGRTPEVRDAPPAPTRTAGVGRDGADTRVPDDIPDADGDDVFARQLREAAMNEPDPELREKLWDEYRRYRART
jgi:hypothetical protein